MWKNMRNLAKYAHIYVALMLHMPHIHGIFFRIFPTYANSSDCRSQVSQEFWDAWKPHPK